MRLENKVALVTGGARGIGKATSLKFAMEGAKVAVCDVLDEDLKKLEDEATEKNLAIKTYHLDVTDREEVRKTLEKVVDDFGKLDIVINNAGITRDAFLVKMTEDQWDKVIDVNLKGVFNVTQAAFNYLKQNGGAVLSTSSVVGRFGNIGQTNYAATKAGVIGMTLTWAKEFSRYNIRANVVAPGFIKTPMTENLSEKVINYMIEKTPLRKMGNEEDVANAFLFLASDEANFITGQILGVDGGLVI